jgi:hypothetical protein
MLNALTNKQGKGTKRVAKEAPYIVKEKGVFGHCECGYEIYYYSDRGIRCSACAKLYGTWKEKTQK